MALVKILRILSTSLIIFGIVLRTVWVADLLAFCCPPLLLPKQLYFQRTLNAGAQQSVACGSCVVLIREAQQQVICLNYYVKTGISWRLIGIQFICVLLLQGYGLQCCRNNFRCQRSDKWTETDCPEVGLPIVFTCLRCQVQFCLCIKAKWTRTQIVWNRTARSERL